MRGKAGGRTHLLRKQIEAMEGLAARWAAVPPHHCADPPRPTSAPVWIAYYLKTTKSTSKILTLRQGRLSPAKKDRLRGRVEELIPA